VQRTYTPIQAKMEAERCLMCDDAPCTCNCPSGVDARGFIRKIRFDNLDGAIKLLRRANVLAASCARICPTGRTCAKECTSKGLLDAIDIAGLQRFVMDYEMERGMINPSHPNLNGISVAVIGSGPAGLGCAAELALLGHPVTVFEKLSLPGGVLRHHIPSFRLASDVVDFEVEFIKKLGVKFECNSYIDDYKKLFDDGFGAIFIATGLIKSKDSLIDGSNKKGVYGAMDFLYSIKQNNLDDLGDDIAVIGGGDTAMDVARVAVRKGKCATVIYRRSRSDMPAYDEDIDDAWKEGAEFRFLTVPLEIIGGENVEGIRCTRIKWKIPKGGSSRPFEFDAVGDEFVIPCDTVVFAMGQIPDLTFSLKVSKRGFIDVGSNGFSTSETGVFAGGDITYAGTAVQAVGMGKAAAGIIDGYLTKKD